MGPTNSWKMAGCLRRKLATRPDISRERARLETVETGIAPVGSAAMMSLRASRGRSSLDLLMMGMVSK